MVNEAYLIDVANWNSATDNLRNAFRDSMAERRFGKADTRQSWVDFAAGWNAAVSMAEADMKAIYFSMTGGKS